MVVTTAKLSPASTTLAVPSPVARFLVAPSPDLAAALLRISASKQEPRELEDQSARLAIEIDHLVADIELAHEIGLRRAATA